MWHFFFVSNKSNNLLRFVKFFYLYCMLCAQGIDPVLIKLKRNQEQIFRPKKQCIGSVTKNQKPNQNPDQKPDQKPDQRQNQNPNRYEFVSDVCTQKKSGFGFGYWVDQFNSFDPSIHFIWSINSFHLIHQFISIHFNLFQFIHKYMLEIKCVLSVNELKSI